MERRHTLSAVNFLLAVDRGPSDRGSDTSTDLDTLATALADAAHAAGHTPNRRPIDFLILVTAEESTGTGHPGEVIESNRNVVRIGDSWTSADDLAGLFLTRAVGRDLYAVAWRAHPSTRATVRASRPSDVVVEEFQSFLDQLQEPDRATPAALRAAMEAVASLWFIHASALALVGDDRRVGDAFARLLGELATIQDPPRGVIQEAAHWFVRKLDVFADEFAKTAGGAAGKGAVVASGVGLVWATGKAGDLANAVRSLWEMVR